LRGAKVELEEAGEDVDGMAESTSQLQAKLFALTHGKVDIMLDADTFKNTTQILREMAGAWEDMTDIERASALELMGGKRQANILASVIKNFDTVEDVITTSMESSGSALAENEKYLSSIQGRIDLFTNSLQTMWMNFLDSDVIKFIVDLGTSLIKLVDNIGLIPSAAGIFAGWKLASKELEKAFGKTSISTKELKKNLNDYINQQTQVVDVSEQVATAKEAEANASTNAANADQLEGQMSTFAAEADTVEANASIDAANADQLEGQMSMFASEADNVEANASTNAANADQLEGQMSLFDGGFPTIPVGSESGKGGLGLKGILGKGATGLKALGIAFGKAALVMAAVKAATWTIGKVWEKLDKEVFRRAEHIKEEVEDLKNTFESAKETFDDNLSELTKSSDTKLYSTLQDEFEALTRGVDEYGNNISLTSDQYERYKEICEKIIGINPNLARGYDDAAKAIGNNVDVLSELIELQKRQARQNVDTIINDDSFGKIAEDANNNAKTAKQTSNKNNYSSASSAWDVISNAVSGRLETAVVDGRHLTTDINRSGSNKDEVMSYILEQIGYTEEEIQNVLTKYWNKYANVYNTNQFMLDYYNEIATNVDKFGEEYKLLLGNALSEIERTIRNGSDGIQDAQDGLIDDFLLVPQGTEAGQYYDQLNDASKKFIIDWIKSSSQFKVDNNQTADAAKANRDKIIQMVQDLADEGFTVEFNGKQITGQDLLNQLYNFDPSTVNWDTYKTQIEKYIDTIWTLIGGEGNQYGITDKNGLALSLGFNFEKDNKELEADKKLIADRLDTTVDDINEFVAGMTAEEVQAFYKINWNDAEHSDDDTKQEIMDAIHNKMKTMQDVVSVKTYSVLTEELDTYNEALSQTAEIVTNNTQVTQEYKDSLIALGISEEELNKYFDENNDLVVKNAKGLNNLVKAAKKNTVENIKLAKSQARLDYYELYKKMRKIVNEKGELSDSSKEQVLTLYQEMGALQKTIAKYALLEAGMSDVIRTYEEFAEAQEFDSETDYISTVEDMIMALGEAFNTAKLGTETAQTAIRGLIPEDVYEDIEALDTAEEKMAAIYDYFRNGKIAQYFTLEFDDDGAITSAEMKLGNLRKFIEDGLNLDENGDGIKVFEGADWQHFELSDEFLAGVQEHIKNGGDGLQYFADQFGVTREVALAFFKTIEDHDIEWLMGDYSSLIEQIIPSSLESKIYDTTQALAELDAQLASGKITPEEYATKYQELNGSLDEFGKKAREDIALHNDLTKQLAEQKKIMQDATAVLNNANSTDAEKEAALSTLTEATRKAQELSSQLKGIEVTEVTIQFALDYVDAEIDKIEQELQSKINFGEDGTYTVKVGVQLTDDELARMEQYKKLWEERHEIEVETDPDDAKTALELIESAAQSALDVINNIDGTTITIDTSSAVSSVSALYDALQLLLSVNPPKTVDPPTTTTPRKTNQNRGRGGHQTAEDRNNLMLADGTAHASGDWGLPTNEHDALVGELGAELVVDPQSGRYYTVGDNGAEFVDLKRGSIIFNHKQTEGLLKNGHITSRGKAYADGNAHVTIWPNASSKNQWEGTGYDSWDDPTYDLQEALDGASGSANDFEETLDWISIRMEEYAERIEQLSAELENEIGYVNKNEKIQDIIDLNNLKLPELQRAADYYNNKAESYLAGLSPELANAARYGEIAISEYTNEEDEQTVEAINKYRQYAQEAAAKEKEIAETITEINNLYKQAFDNIANDFDNELSLVDSKIAQLEAHNDLLETDTGFASEDIYRAIQNETQAKIDQNKQKRDTLQAELSTGKIKEGTDAWYEAINTIAAVDAEIIQLNADIENTQDKINNLHWEKFDLLITKFQAVSDEAENLLGILATEDAVDELGNWTNEGIASLGLLSQQMEVAEKEAAKYQEEIDYLNANWKSLGYTQEEYTEKLEELKSNQYDAINSYHDAKDAIVELNEARIDAIKNGIEKEIEAYKKLIDAKKEELDAEQDLHDFQKGVMEQQKDIAAIERQLAALSGDNSMSARAKRAQLEAELAEAKAELEETYYDRSVSEQQNALDRELENFQETKDKEVEELDKYLENVELVVADSIAMVQANANVVYAMLTALGQQYGLNIATALTQPWIAGETAIQNYGAKLNVSLTTLASMFGLTVDEFAAKLGLTTEMLVSNLDITVAQMATNLGLTNEQLAAKLGITVTSLNGMMDLSIQELAAKMGLTLPALAEQLGTTTAGLAGNLDMTMTQFAGSMGLTVEELAGKFGLSAEGLANKLGMTYQDLMNPFGLSMSATVDALKSLEEEYGNILAGIQAESINTVNSVNNAMDGYKEVNEEAPKEPESPKEPKEITVGGKINAGNAKIYKDSYGGGASTQYFASDPIYTVLRENNGYVLVRHHKLKSGYTGWFKKSDIQAYASGTLGTKRSQIALIDELGEELVMHAGQNGKLQYLSKGTSVIPHDISENLMKLGQLDPTEVLSRSTPQIGVSPSIMNNKTEINLNIAEVVHVDHVDHDTLPDLTKAVRKEMDSYMLKVNNAIKAKVR